MVKKLNFLRKFSTKRVKPLTNKNGFQLKGLIVKTANYSWHSAHAKLLGHWHRTFSFAQGLF